MSEHVEDEEKEVADKEQTEESSDIQQIEITAEQLDALLAEEERINIAELLETEMVLSRTLYLSEEITLDTISHIIQLIHKFNRDDHDVPIEERHPITIYFDSAGGEIYRGFSLVSTIESSKTPVIGVLQGTCMSMCLPIWLACHVRYASRFSTVLYHTLRASADVETLIEMENKLNHYRHLQDTLDNYILEKTEIPKRKLKEKRKSNLDWFITFDQMTKYKLYDHLID